MLSTNTCSIVWAGSDTHSGLWVSCPTSVIDDLMMMVREKVREKVRVPGQDLG